MARATQELVRGNVSIQHGGCYALRAMAQKQHQGERFSRTEQRERSRVVGSWTNKAHISLCCVEISKSIIKASNFLTGFFD